MYVIIFRKSSRLLLYNMHIILLLFFTRHVYILAGSEKFHTSTNRHQCQSVWDVRFYNLLFFLVQTLLEECWRHLYIPTRRNIMPRNNVVRAHTHTHTHTATYNSNLTSHDDRPSASVSHSVFGTTRAAVKNIYILYFRNVIITHTHTHTYI